MKFFLRTLIVCTLAVIIMSGCNVFYNDDEGELTEADIEMAARATFPQPSESPKTNKKMKAIHIYSINTEDKTTEPINIKVESDIITPEFIVNKVIENLTDSVVVTEISIEKKKMTITFDSKKAPLVGCTEENETLILDCISNSILDNINYVDSIIFDTEKGAYKSNHLELGKNEIYSSR